MKKFLFQTFLIYVTCMACIFLLNEIFIERHSAKDFEGFIVFSFAHLIIMVACIYWPALIFIEKRYGAPSRKRYPVLTAFVCKIPYLVFAVLMSGKAFQPTEAILFCTMFIVIGYSFGKFYSNYRMGEAQYE